MINRLLRSFGFGPSARQEKDNPNYLQYQTYDQAGRLPQPVTMPKNYQSFAKEGYKGNDTAYKCVSYIARNAASVQFGLYSDRTLKTEIEAHAILDLLDTPNNEQSRADFIEACIGFLLIAGNAFQYSLRLQKNGPPAELWPLRPDLMNILPNEKGIVTYEYGIAPSNPKYYDPSEIGHLKYWNPDNDLWGLSPIEVAAITIDQQSAAKKWNLALLQNSGRPPGAWTTPATMSMNDRNKLEDKLNAKFSGPKSAGKIPVLDGGLSWESMGLPPAQVDWLEGIKYNGGSIANIYSLAPQLVGDTSASTYNNMKEAKFASYTEAIFPALDKLFALWNRWLIPMYDPSRRLVLAYKKNSVETIQEVIQEQMTAVSERANKMYMSGRCSLNEARDIDGLPPIPQGDIYRIQNILVPADQLEEFAEKSMIAPVVPPMPTPEGENNNTPPAKPAKPGKRAAPYSLKALNLETAEQKSAYMASMEDMRHTWEGKAASMLTEAFSAQQKAVVAAIASAALPETASMRAEAAINSNAPAMKQTLGNIYVGTAKDIGMHISKEIHAISTGKKAGNTIANQVTSNAVLYLLRIAGQKIAFINATTLAMLKLALADGVELGESIPQLAKRIDALYLQEIIPNRSETIARTEVVAASNWAAMQSAEHSGLELTKVWLATEDSRTRPDHVAADGQEVAMHDQFDIGGFKMDQPGDFNAPADEVVNCFPGDTFVTAENVQAATKRWYEGELVEIETSLGYKLSGTPNHPILTSRGWVALGLLQKGDSIICGTFTKKMALSHPDVNYVPAPLSQVYDTIASTGIMERVVGVDVDFHGDGMDTDVNIVRPTSLLGNNVSNTSCLEPRDKQLFTSADLDKTLLFERSLGGLPLRTISKMSGFSCEDFSFDKGSLAHSQVHAVGTIASGNSSISQNSLNNSSGDTELLSEGINRASTLEKRSNFSLDSSMNDTGFTDPASSVNDGPSISDPEIGGGNTYVQDETNFFQTFTGLIQLTRITKIVRRAFCGHVYNLQTKSSWYIANSIVSHNCRCTVYFNQVNPDESFAHDDIMNELDTPDPSANPFEQMNNPRVTPARASRQEYQTFIRNLL